MKKKTPLRRGWRHEGGGFFVRASLMLTNVRIVWRSFSVVTFLQSQSASSGLPFSNLAICHARIACVSVGSPRGRFFRADIFLPLFDLSNTLITHIFGSDNIPARVSSLHGYPHLTELWETDIMTLSIAPSGLSLLRCDIHIPYD